MRIPSSKEIQKSQSADLCPKYVEKVYAQTLRYAVYRTRSKERGRELAHEVLLQALDPTPTRDGHPLEPWDRNKNPDLGGYLIGQVDGAVARERKADRVRRDARVVGAIETRLYPPVPTPEQEAQ